MKLTDCLPADLSGPAATTITRIAAGLSGAGVYRIEAAGRLFVLKVAVESETDANWLRTLHIQQLAADAGLTPRIVHVDEARRAVLTDWVTARSFAAFYHDPRTHQAALTQLGRTVRRIHALPIPVGASMSTPAAFLAQTWGGIPKDFALPVFAHEAIDRVLTEKRPPNERARVLSHNDLNPSNLIYDGETIMLVDWAAAGPMEPFYDLAVLCVFLRMDEDACLRLLSAYDDCPLGALPRRFIYIRRLAAALAGAMHLHLARQLKHAGATGNEALASTLSLGAFYQLLRDGTLKLGTADGHWAFGLSLLTQSLAL